MVVVIIVVIDSITTITITAVARLPGLYSMIFLWPPLIELEFAAFFATFEENLC